MAQATKEHTRHPGRALSKLIREVGPFAIVGILGAIGLLLLFAKLSEEVFSKEITNLDDKVSLWIHGFAAPPLDTAFNIISTYAGVVTVIALSIIAFGLLLWLKHPYEAWRLVLVMLGGLGINLALKFFFQRARPALWPGAHFSGYSFPSGHATMSFCLFGMLIWLSWRYLQSRALQLVLTVLLGIVILLVGVSRIYLGAHYLSDILAGYIAAAFWMVAVLSGTDIFERIRGERLNSQVEA